MKKVVKKSKKEIILETNRDIAFDFATRTYKKFKDIIKAIALFGSTTKMQADEKSDIDIIVIIDDCTVNWDDELIAWYREELAKLIAEKDYKKELHINTVTLTAFWEEVRVGEPLVINVLRYGEPLIDIGGFFDPLKVLLAKGKIRPSPEAIFTTMQRSGQHLQRANTFLLNSVEGFYWAMVDAAHATLMALKVVPPSPEQLPQLLKEVLVNKNMLNKKYLDYYEHVRKTAKEVLHNDKTKLQGKDMEELQGMSESFVYELNEITKALIRNEKIIKYELKP